MKRKTVFAVVLLLVSGFTAAAIAAEPEPDGGGWQLINRDAKGNRLYVVPDAAEEAATGIKRIWMKFETDAPNSPSPMLFLNEIDCSQGMIKRLKVKLYKPTCATAGEAVQQMSFDGRWDKPSQGIEELIYGAVCRPADKENP